MSKYYYDLVNRTSRRNRIYGHLERIEKNISCHDTLSPVTLELHLTNRCNSHCSFCLFSERNQSELSKETIDTILEDCYILGIKSVTISGGGEPTVHPDIAYTINTFVDHNIDVGLMTNGILLSPDLEAALKRCTWIRYSLLAPSVERYCKYTNMPKEIYYQVLSNIAQIGKDDCRKTIIGITHLIDPDDTDFDNLMGSVILANQIGADQVFYTEKVDKFNTFRLDKQRIEPFFTEIKAASEAFQVATNIERFIYRTIEGIEKRRNAYTPCEILYHNLETFITPSGDVYPCMSIGIDQRFKPLGNIRQARLTELLQKNRIVNYYDEFSGYSCENCKMLSQRSEIQHYLRTHNKKAVRDPHVNFI